MPPGAPRNEKFCSRRHETDHRHEPLTSVGGFVEGREDRSGPLVHWSPKGANDAPDAVIMANAAQSGSIVLTHDLDFGAILAATHNTAPSVVHIRAENVSPDAIGRVVVDTLKQMEPDLARGALVTIDVDRIRLRILPFPSAG